MSSPKIIFIATSHAVMGDTQEPTGVWLEELSTPYYQLIDAGFQVDVGSIKGGKIPVDPRSQQPQGENADSVERMLEDFEAMHKITHSTAIEAIDFSAYDVLFLPGGHGTMWDLPGSERLASVIPAMLENGKVVSAVCHGPVGLVSAKYTNGTPVVAGKRVTGFTNAEESAVGLTEVVPYLLESKLRELGAAYESGPDFEPFAVRDGNLITGQNPVSSEAVAELVIQALGES